MNNCTLVGKVTKEGLKVNDKGTMAKFSFSTRKRFGADKEGNNNYSFHNAKIIGERAVKFAKDYVLSGATLGFCGSYEQEKWEKDGQQHSMQLLYVERVEFVTPKGENGGSAPAPKTDAAKPAETAAAPTVEDDDIPF